MGAFESLPALPALEGPWSRLAGAHAPPTSQFPWVRAAIEAFGAAAPPRLFARPEAGGLGAAAALVLRTRPGGARLESLGVDELYEPTDLVARDDEARALVAREIAASGLPLRLERLPAESPWIESLRRAYAGRGAVIVRQAHPCPVIPLDPGWKDPDSRFNARRRSDFRRALRHAEAQGPVAFEVLEPRDDEDLSRRLDEAFEVEASGWKGESACALQHDALRGDFFRRYARYAARAGTLRLAFMRVGGRAVAMQLAAQTADAFWLLKIGYDERCARASPGMLLMRHTVAYAAHQGLARYEMLGRAESWTEAWTRELRRCVALHAYPATLRGARALCFDGWAAARRRLARPPA